MILILITSIVALIVLNIWNLISLRRLTKNRKVEDKQLNDEKYYELKYKNEFLVAIFTVITAIAGFLGYNSYQTINGKIAEELKPILTRIDLAEDSINIIEKNITNKDSLVRYLDDQTANISTTYKSIEKNFSHLGEKINLINSKNIIKQNYYLVKSIGFKYADDIVTKEFYFKDLTTSLGDKLPLFESPPIIIPVAETGAQVKVLNVTNYSFEVTTNELWGNAPDSVKLSLVIIK